MSSKSRKAIPLKEELTVPTSFDVGKLYETMVAFSVQLENAATHFSEQGMVLENKSSEMYDLADILGIARSNLKDTCEQLAAFTD